LHWYYKFTITLRHGKIVTVILRRREHLGICCNWSNILFEWQLYVFRKWTTKTKNMLSIIDNNAHVLQL